MTLESLKDRRQLAGAGHSFQEPGDVHGSVANLAFVVTAVLEFLGLP